MKNKLLNNIIPLLSFTSLLIGCNRDDIDLPRGESMQSMVNIGLHIEQPTQLSNDTETAATKSSIVDEVSMKVKNLWILQYDDEENLVGSPIYLDDMAGFKDDLAEDIDYRITNVGLLNSDGAENTLVFIANTFDDKFAVGDNKDKISTLLQLSKLTYPLYTDGNFNYGIKEIDGSKFTMMSCVVKTEIPVYIIECNMMSNVAKITVNIDSHECSKTTPSKIQLCAVPNAAYYAIDKSTIIGVGKTFPSKVDFKPLDYNTEDIGTESSFTFYMPTNIRGDVDMVDTPESKPLYADKFNTYIKIISDVNGSATQHIEYNFHLGESLNNFDVKPHKEYIYNITIKDVDKSDADLDNRVEYIDDDVIDYTVEKCSNCYILNPNASSDRIYYIPIARRINEFWGNNGYENNPNNIITDDDNDYTVELSWHDLKDGVKTFDCATLQDVADVITFDPKEEAPSGQNAMKVTLKEGKPDCNVVIKVMRGSTILWTWHFWITDYNPYANGSYKSKYAMSVPGGEVHSYEGKIWNDPSNSTSYSNRYAGKYIMDRNIGARNSNDGKYCLFYQFGRKDPFRAINNGEVGDYISNLTDIVTILDFMENPNTCYSRIDVDFPLDPKYNSKDIVWNDPKIEINGAISPGVNRKSIFDPSPLGWKVPNQKTWEDLGSDGKFQYITDDNPLNYKRGRYYNPTSSASDFSTQKNYLAYYPATGYIVNGNTDGSVGTNSGKYSDNGCGYAWTNKAYDRIRCHMLLFRNSEEFNYEFLFYKACGRPVRAVSE